MQAWVYWWILSLDQALLAFSILWILCWRDATIVWRIFGGRSIVKKPFLISFFAFDCFTLSSSVDCKLLHKAWRNGLQSCFSKLNHSYFTKLQSKRQSSEHTKGWACKLIPLLWNAFIWNCETTNGATNKHSNEIECLITLTPTIAPKHMQKSL